MDSPSNSAEQYDPLNYDQLSLDTLLQRASITKSMTEMIRIHAIILQRYHVGRDDEALKKARDELAIYLERMHHDLARHAVILTELELTLLEPPSPQSIVDEEGRIALFKEGEE